MLTKQWLYAGTVAVGFAVLLAVGMATRPHAEAPYYSWVDQHNILGLGADTPSGTGNFSDSLHALMYRKVVQLRVPYPMGFFTKGLDGRIDDPNAGWKGIGISVKALVDLTPCTSFCYNPVTLWESEDIGAGWQAWRRGFASTGKRSNAHGNR